MADRTTSEAAAHGPDWRAVVDALEHRGDLSAAEWDQLADALFWVDRVEDSVRAHHRAYQCHLDDGDLVAAARRAWRIFYEHFLVGEEAIASGWIERSRRHAIDADAPIARAWVAIADADRHARRGEHREAAALAAATAEVGRHHGDADVVAMALQVEGRALIDLGERRDGLARLDEAMVAVINNELGALFTGWVYCNVVSTCVGIADLRRANEWSEAALRWCQTLRDGRMYRGLCRVYAVQLAVLHGRWDDAASEAVVASTDLEAFDPRYAGAAHHLVGELARLRGDAADAAAAFSRAASLGHPAQPGIALLALDSGQVDEAAAAILTELKREDASPLEQARLALALLTVAEVAGDKEIAVEAAEFAARAAETEAAVVVDGLAAAAAGRGALLRGDLDEAVDALRRGKTILGELDMPFDMADASGYLAEALHAAGDDLSARSMCAEALATFEELGAVPSAARLQPLASLLGVAFTAEPSGNGGLTAREREVLGHVAAGQTNKQIAAELLLSHHTVARHVSNIFTKLGVNTRAAATARGLEQGLIN